MTYPIPGHGAVPVLPSILFPPLPPPHLSREMVYRAVTLRRARLAELEEQMVEPCDTAAGRGDPTAAPDDRRRWDRAAWDRYLATAARLEDNYGPRMRRLRDDIARLDRLLDLPLTE